MENIQHIHEDNSKLLHSQRVQMLLFPDIHTVLYYLLHGLRQLQKYAQMGQKNETKPLEKRRIISFFVFYDICYLQITYYYTVVLPKTVTWMTLVFHTTEKALTSEKKKVSAVFTKFSSPQFNTPLTENKDTLINSKG